MWLGSDGVYDSSAREIEARAQCGHAWNVDKQRDKRKGEGHMARIAHWCLR